MSLPLIVRPAAEEDLTDARDWYNRMRESLGREFLAAVDEVFDRIQRSPDLSVAEYKSVRRAGIRRFPYVVYYRITSDTVEVIAILHGSRNPRQWRSRA